MTSKPKAPPPRMLEVPLSWVAQVLAVVDPRAWLQPSGRPSIHRGAGGRLPAAAINQRGRTRRCKGPHAGLVAAAAAAALQSGM